MVWLIGTLETQEAEDEYLNGGTIKFKQMKHHTNNLNYKHLHQVEQDKSNHQQHTMIINTAQIVLTFTNSTNFITRHYYKLI